jgi:hypothetical protein
MKKKEVVLPVRVAEQTARLLKQVADNRPLTPRIRRKLSQAAAELEVRISLTSDGQVKIPNKLMVAVLRGIAFLVHFRTEIQEVASALMSIKINK